MLKSLTTLPLMAALLFATATNAQETTEPATTEPATEETQPAGAGAAGGLSMGREVGRNEAYVKESHGDWDLKCFGKAEGEAEVCQMYQLLNDPETGKPIAEFSIFRLPEGAQAVAGATVVVPLGTLLSEELKIYVDIGVAKSYPFSFCTMQGCFARVGFTADDIAAMKRGAIANLQLVPAQAPDQKVTIQGSLKGFSDAFDAVSTLAN
jgi:invasion protein IalB